MARAGVVVRQISHRNMLANSPISETPLSEARLGARLTLTARLIVGLSRGLARID